MAFSLDSFYRTREWERFRLGVIESRVNEQGLVICEHCGKPILKMYDCIAHHIKELTARNVNDVMVSLNPENIQLVHHVCHNRIHNKFGRIERQVFLVYGSPFSGKSSYVESVREPGDLVIDIDDIWRCVSGCDKYIKPDRLKSNVFGVRDLLLEQVRMRVGKWNNAYIVGGYALSGERERLCKRLGAREIYIDCSIEECITRLENCVDMRAKNKTEWRGFIEDWWRKYSPQGSNL